MKGIWKTMAHAPKNKAILVFSDQKQNPPPIQDGSVLVEDGFCLARWSEKLGLWCLVGSYDSMIVNPIMWNSEYEINTLNKDSIVVGVVEVKLSGSSFYINITMGFMLNQYRDLLSCNSTLNEFKLVLEHIAMKDFNRNAEILYGCYTGLVEYQEMLEIIRSSELLLKI